MNNDRNTQANGKVGNKGENNLRKTVNEGRLIATVVNKD